jgi:hypothetical protein
MISATLKSISVSFDYSKQRIISLNDITKRRRSEILISIEAMSPNYHAFLTVQCVHHTKTTIPIRGGRQVAEHVRLPRTPGNCIDVRYKRFADVGTCGRTMTCNY